MPFKKNFCLSRKIDVLWVVSVLHNGGDIVQLTFAVCQTVLTNMYVGDAGALD